MATQWQSFPFKLEGGLITNLGRIEQGVQAPGSATVLENFEPDIEGGYTRILGYQRFIDVPVPGTGIVRAVFSVGQSEALAERGGKIYYTAGVGWAEKLTLTNPNIIRMRKDSYNFTGVKKTVVIDGVNAPAYYNHVTKTMDYVVAPPTEVVGASRLAVFKSHIFFAKNNLVSFSSPYLESDFAPSNGAGVINVGDAVTGLTVFRDQLIIFCLNSIFRLSGSSQADFVLSPITSNTGCLCGDTIQEVGGDIMYLGPDGIRYLSASERENDFGLTRASEKIQRKVLAQANTNCFYSSVTIAEKNQYRLFTFVANVPRANAKGFLAAKFSNQTVNDISWAELRGLKVYDISKHQERDREVILFSSDTDYIYRMESGNSFDGEDISAVYETPFIPVTDPKLRKTFYKHTLYAKPMGQMTLVAQLKFDYIQGGSSPSPVFSIDGSSASAVYGDPSSVYGSSVYGTSTEEQFYNNVVGSGFVVAIRYSSVSQLPPFNLNFVVLEFRQNERR